LFGGGVAPPEKINLAGVLLDGGFIACLFAWGYQDIRSAVTLSSDTLSVIGWDAVRIPLREIHSIQFFRSIYKGGSGLRITAKTGKTISVSDDLPGFKELAANLRTATGIPKRPNEQY
jgi:hypothetical protein